MRSVSLSALPAPFRRTTQTAPFGSIQDLTCRSRSRSRLPAAAMKTRSQGASGLPTTMSRVRCRSSFTNQASSMSNSATLAPGLTPSLSRSGLVVSATDGSKHDHPQEPAAIGTGDGKRDQRNRVADAAGEKAAETDHGPEDDGTAHASGHSTEKGRGRTWFQTSITCRSLTAPGTEPEYTWLKKKRVSGWRFFNFPAASQLMWLKTSPGPVASTIATSAPFTSLSSGAVDSVSPE